jgi:hypothetical protein
VCSFLRFSRFWGFLWHSALALRLVSLTDWKARTLTILSSDAVMSCRPSLEKLTLRTGPECALITVDRPSLTGVNVRQHLSNAAHCLASGPKGVHESLLIG